MLDERQQTQLKAANADTRKEILQRAKRIEESGLLEHPGWKLYEELLKEQLDVRVAVMQQPLHDILPGKPMDERAMQMESVKGAFIGLRLALSLPRTIIESAEQIRREENKVVQPEDSQTPGAKSP